MGDTALSSFGGHLTIAKSATTYDDVALIVDASAIATGTNKVTVNLNHTSNTAGETLAYTLGAGIDEVAAATDLADAFTVTTAGHLAATDTIKGGSGSDTLTFNTNAALTVTADQLAALSGVETVTVNHGTTESGAAVITLSDAVAVANAASATNTFTVSRQTSEAGTLRVNGNTVSAVNLSIVGAGGSDTLTGGAANDTISGNAGVDSLTGGAGNDTFLYVLAADVSAGETIAGGDGTDRIQLNHGAAGDISYDFRNAIISGIEEIDAISNDGGDAVVFNSAQLSATTKIDESTAATDMVVQVVAGGTTVDLSGFTFSADRAAGITVTNDGAFSTQSIAATGTTKADAITGGSNVDTITGGLGADTITGGYGNDLILLSETTASVDVLRYAEYGTANADAVIGATAGSDIVSISVGNLTPSSGGTAYTFATTSGLDRAAAIAAGDFGILSQAVDTADTASNSTTHDLIFLSSTAATSFATAIGNGSIVTDDADGGGADLELVATEGVVTVWYDSANLQAVFGLLVNTSTATADRLLAVDTFVEITRVGMLAADYTAANIDAMVAAH